MPTPSRNDIYEAVIRKMVSQALEEQEERFEQTHAEDTDEALILYLQDSARELGYSPRYKEIMGWRLLEQRFISWSDALQKAGLPPAARCPVTKLPRILEETEKQKELYRRKKAEKKLRNRQRMESQERRKNMQIDRPVFLPLHRPVKEKLSDCPTDSFPGSLLVVNCSPSSGQ